ncbi:MULTISPECIES: Sec-independent protein translocase TatB [unclassified Corynebacterium]|uniref:Sec-independent protein translocase TatB n=1 Tax=unclassified Corynebacterium TaxID=2624378 RepID=UPI0021AAD34C|nr:MULTISPECIES: Sec-independent protein translocase TatB [unclassified Corynebacterium]MCT1452826.1 Sec-independent protein translocase TatB [Corynebacterium sp. p3-SID1145]MCT1461742.1 Sec-independent protein translocase TatB [Corynebacterium sp. p3-SID1140]MDN8594819.1 Sec-independent protein translocase TatB [Corynebacterium sp. P4_F2]WKK56333.1 Sec-independent protein translocase TatB [Corynebacterium sp. P4-C1]WKK63766.1 Sec-independent protein translocase TatB [Corynebacterium sp. P8-C1
MFDSIGWGEIFVVILAGLIIIGPERLPGVIMDVRAAIFAARRAIDNAKEELYGDEFDELRKPMSTVTEYAAMGPKRAIAKVLFDEDSSYLDQFDPRQMMDGDPAVGRRAGSAAAGGTGQSEQPVQSEPPAQPEAPRRSKPRRMQPGMGAEQPKQSGGGGFSWTDVT